MKQRLDFYCNGFRWFNNYEETEKYYRKIENKPNIRQYYGQGVLTFNNITEINTIIQELTLLRDSIIHNNSKHPNIQKEFGTSNIYKDIPYDGEPIFELYGGEPKEYYESRT